MFRVEYQGASSTAKAVCHCCKAEQSAHIWSKTDSITQCVTPSGWVEKLEGRMLRLYCPTCA